MKKTTLLILITVTLCCCKKSGNDYSALKNDLVNQWEIRKAVGGIGGIVNYQPGNGYVLEFKNDNTFVNYSKGSIVRSGTYDLQSTSERDKYRITLHTNVDDLTHDLVLKGDTLVLGRYAPCCDIPDNTFVKIN
jgi:hypothetical protein